MSISNALSNALSGLTAASRMAEVVSSNLSNALTDGYGRRQVDLSAQSIGGNGAGVRIDGISRIVDRGILADRRMADARLASDKTMTKTLAQLESTVGAAGDSTALTARISALEQALISAGTDPASEIRLAAVYHQFSATTSALNQSAEGIRNLRQDTEGNIATQVDTLNRALLQIEELNSAITSARNGGGDASALIDQRQVAVDRVAAIVPVRELERQGGQIALMSRAGQMLVDDRAVQFGFTEANHVTPDMTFALGGLAGVTLDGVPLDAGNSYGKLAGGSLSASFDLRDSTLVTAQAGLDAVARDLVERFQNPANDPTLSPGDAGLLTDNGTAFDPLNTVGLAGRIAVNAAVDPSQSGALFRLRDGVNALVPGPVGDASQLNNWLDALADPLTLAPGATARSAAGHMSKYLSDIGGLRLVADENLSFTSARWSTLRQAELANGVDSDFELQMLLRIEQAYAANARVVETVNSMIQTLMEI